MLESVKPTLHVLYIQAIRYKACMSLRLWNVFIQYLVKRCLPLLEYPSENFKENDRKTKETPCDQLCTLVGGDNKCFKDSSDIIPTSVT